jgi:hypothetical protein
VEVRLDVARRKTKEKLPEEVEEGVMLKLWMLPFPEWVPTEAGASTAAGDMWAGRTRLLAGFCSPCAAHPEVLRELQGWGRICLVGRERWG